MPMMADHSITAQCVADPVIHEFLVDVFSRSITGDDVRNPPKMGELLTRLQVRTERTLHALCAFHLSLMLSDRNVSAICESVDDRSVSWRRRTQGVLQY